MFHNFTLIHNHRKIVKVATTKEKDGGFVVVDVDTLWKNKKTGQSMDWLGRTCKTYVQTFSGYKMIAQTGVLEY